MSAREAVERVVSAIVEEVYSETTAELRKAFEEALSLLEKARQDVLQEVKRRVSEGRRRAESLKLQRIGAAEMKAKWARVKLLDEFVNQIFSESLERIKGLRDKRQYRTILEGLVQEGLAALNTRSALLMGSGEDKHLLKEVATSLSREGYSLRVSDETLETVGGVKVMLEDGSVTYDNTFEARLERLKPELRRMLYTLVGG